MRIFKWGISSPTTPRVSSLQARPTKTLSIAYMPNYNKLTKKFYDTDYKEFLISASLESTDSSDTDYFRDSSQSQSFSQSFQPSQSSQSEKKSSE